MGAKPLTWQQVLIVIFIILGALSLLLAVGTIITPNARPLNARETRNSLVAVSITGFIGIISVLAIVALWRSHSKQHNRQDIYPDILKQRGQDNVFQMGDAHLCFDATQIGDQLRFLVTVQNRFDSVNRVVVQLTPTVLTTKLRNDIPPLEIEIGPADVVQSEIFLPLEATTRRTSVKVRVSGSSQASGGRQVRFARYAAVVLRVNPGLTAALLVTGTVYAGGGTYVTIPIFPPSNSLSFNSFQTTDVWQSAIVWSPPPAPLA